MNLGLDKLKDALRDAVYHIPLGLGLGALTIGPYLVMNIYSAALVNGAWALFFREATQKQMDDYSGDFERGWDFWNWSVGKNIETWIPVALLLGASFLVAWLV